MLIGVIPYCSTLIYGSGDHYPISTRTENHLQLSFLFHFVAVPSLPDVATEAVILTPSMITGDPEGETGAVPGLEEFSISKIINRQFSGELMKVLTFG